MSVLNFLGDEIFRKSYSSKQILILSFVVFYLNAEVNAFLAFGDSGFSFFSFLSSPQAWFADFFRALDQLPLRDQFGQTIALIGDDKILLLLIFYGTWVISFTFLAKRTGNSGTTLFLIALSYPLLFAINAGSHGLLIVLLVMCALLTRSLFLAAFSIGMACLGDFTSIVFALPALFKQAPTRKSVTQFVIFLTGWLLYFYTIRTLAFPTAPTIPFADFFGQGGSFEPVSVAFGSSILSPLAFLATKWGGTKFFAIRGLPSLLAVLVFASIALVCQLKGKLTKSFTSLLSFDKLVFVSCISFVLFSPSPDYSLLIMLVPLVLFPNAVFSFGYYFVFGLLLGAKNIFYVGVLDGQRVFLQIFLNPALLSMMLLAEFDLIGFMKRNSPELIVIPTSLKTELAVWLVVLAGFAYGGPWLYWKSNRRQVHNRQMDLPLDFDPAMYLRVHPGLQEYWQSVGIKESGRALHERAEIHYKEFGRRDSWPYK